MSDDSAENSTLDDFQTPSPSPPPPPAPSPLPCVTKSQSDGALKDELILLSGGALSGSSHHPTNLLNQNRVLLEVGVHNSVSEHDHLSHLYSSSGLLNPGDSRPQQHSQSTEASANLPESLSSLYLPHLSRQLGTTIMSGLNWINQFDFNSLLHNLVINTNIFRRRNSTTTLGSITKTTVPSNASATMAPLSSGTGPPFAYNSSTLQSKMVAKMLNGTLKPLSKSETIELESFGVVELDNDESGIGHDFQRYENDKPTWCDACAEFLSPPVMNDNERNFSKNGGNNNATNGAAAGSDNATPGGSGIGNQHSGKSSLSLSSSAPVAVQTDHLMRTYLQCRKCNYICHLKCHNLIRIDCRPAVPAIASHSPPTNYLRSHSRPKKNHRHRNSVRFDSMFPDSTGGTISAAPSTETITEARESTTTLDSNNNSPDMTTEEELEISAGDAVANVSTTSDNSSGTAELEPAHQSISSMPSSPASSSSTSSSEGVLTTATEDEVANLTMDSAVFDSTRDLASEDDVTLCDDTEPGDLTTEQSELTEDMSLLNGETKTMDVEQQRPSEVSKPCDSRTYTKSLKATCGSHCLPELLTPTEIVDLKQKILRYNERIRGKGSGLGITLIDTGKQLFRGFLRVHMNLTRPINVIAGKRPPSIYDIINEEEQQNAQQVQQQRRTLTSFYMPRDTVKNIHITSESTSLQVIKAMLKKFKVVDNPQKFALYLRRRFPEEELQRMKDEEQQQNENRSETDDEQQNRRFEQAISQFLTPSSYEHSLKRLHDQERPLVLQLEFDSFLYGAVDIVLQENDNADIAWDAFEVPELRNFLKILDREESEHLDHVRTHYHELKRVIAALIEFEEAKHKQVDIAHPNNSRPSGDKSSDSGGSFPAGSPSGSVVTVES